MSMVKPAEPQLRAYFDRRLIATADLFAVQPVSEHPIALMVRPGASPERIVVSAQPFVTLVYIHCQEHFSCARYELAHEAVHEVLAREQTIFDWVQEMFAEYVAVQAVEELGLEIGLPETVEYAQERAHQHREGAARLSLSELQAADLSVSYPKGTYSRGFVTASSLVEEIGWERLRPLGAMIVEGHHDLDGWLESLDPDERRRAQRVLGRPA